MQRERPAAFGDTTFVVEEGAPCPVDRVLRSVHAGSSWNDVRRLVRTGKVSVDGAVVVDPSSVVRKGATVSIRMTAPRRAGPAGVSREILVHVDAHVVVVQKPAGIATVPYEDERDTLDRLVQRLDKETSGLIVFARTTAAKRGLQQQLRQHTVHRRYLALAHGSVESGVIRSRLVQDRGDGRRGSTERTDMGRESVTHVRVVERFERATLVECRLETGRTHQIRIHLSEEGHPLLGERVYNRGYPGTLLPAPRILLHAAELGFEHPVSGAALRFEQPLPEDMAQVIERERGESHKNG